MPDATDRLRTSIAGIDLRNPVLLAAGTCGTLDEMGDVLDLSRVGGLVTKSITPEAREGNQTWRVVELGVGMLNAIGLANIGVEAFERDVGPRVAGVKTCVIGSAAGFRVDDYVRVAGALGQIEGVRAVELNVSCPNVHGGTEFGLDTRALGELVHQVRRAVPGKPLLVKLPPVALGSPSIVDVARAAIEGRPEGGGAAASGGPGGRPGADALCLCNTTPAMAIDARTRKPRLANVTGGLSGPAVHPIVVRLIHQAYGAIARPTQTPIIGIGGVLRWEDAAAFILAGASAVQMGTGLMADPRSPLRVVKGLDRWVREQGVASVGELVGAVTG
ncbi:MAG: dihydroorotate dehydrogenase [Phycisphaerales bacterium]